MPNISWRSIGRRRTYAAMGRIGVDVSGGYGEKREQRRTDHPGGHDEYGPRRKKISACTHGGCGKAVADGGKAGIAAEPLTDSRVSDQAEADCRHSRSQQATRR